MGLQIAFLSPALALILVTLYDAEPASAKLAYVTSDDTESPRNRGCGVVAALERLATYGTLAPGRPNHHQLDGLEGRWLKGYVDGILVDAGWGASLGYPALVLDSAGSAIAVDVFESIDLPAHWERLDTFEGPGYERVVTTAHMPTGDVAASIYIFCRSRAENWSPTGRRYEQRARQLVRLLTVIRGG